MLEPGYCPKCKSVVEIEGDVKSDGCILKCLICGSEAKEIDDEFMSKLLNIWIKTYR